MSFFPLLSIHSACFKAQSAKGPCQITLVGHQDLGATFQMLFSETENKGQIHTFRSSHLCCKHTPWLQSFTAALSLSTEVNQASFLVCNIISLLMKSYLLFLKNLKNPQTPASPIKNLSDSRAKAVFLNR